MLDKIKFILNSLKKKIVFASVITFVVFALMILIVIYFQATKLLETNLKNTEQYMLKEKQIFIKNELLTAKSAIYTILNSHKNPTEAKKEIIKTLSGMRFLEGSGYFFAYEEKSDGYYFGFHGTKPELNGKKTDINEPDIKGFAFRKELIKYADKDKFTIYHYQKPTTKEVVPKITYSMFIPELHWTLTTGMYIDDINIQLKQIRQDYTEQLNEILKMLSFVVIISVLMIFILLFPLLNIILIQPIKKFQDGLLEFFKYLKKEQKTVNLIDIQTEDEIGQMATEVNKGIETSIKLHSELFNLMNVMDKNVITSETDENGIITYVSEAFCVISGFNKDELIGKSHNVIRHPDMNSLVFKDLWETIKSGKSWRGEIKNRKKDGGFYWVEVVITQKCVEFGANCGYTAIRQDITDKKLAEELSLKQQEQLREIQKFQKLTMGREARMVELKKQVNDFSMKVSNEIVYQVIDEIENLTTKDDYAELSNQDFDLKELLDTERLQLLMEHFYSFMHVPLAIIDLEANILVQSKWQRACTDFHRVNEESCRRCIESDMDLANRLQDGQNFSIYKCKNGLTDCASPLIINGKHLANFFIGQFILGEPDLDFFTKQAITLGYDVDDYLEAIKDVPIMNETKLPYILSFLVEVTNMITSLTIEKLNAKRNDELANIKSQEMENGKIVALNLAEDANTAKNELIKYKEHLEDLVGERTKELENEKKYVNSIMNSQNSIVISTDGTTLKTANRAFFKFFEVQTLEEFTSKYGKCICDTFDSSLSDNYIKKLINNEKWIDYVYNRPNQIHEVKIIHNDSEYIFVITADSFVFDEQELKTAVFIDITQRKYAEKKLLFNQQVVKNSAPMFWINPKTATIEYANQAALKHIGYTQEEFIGMHVIDFDIDFPEERFAPLVEMLLTEKKHIVFESRHKRKDDSLANIEITAYLAEDDEHFFIIALVKDITVEKLMSKRLDESYKHTRESIEYASLIQHSLIPSNDVFRRYFGDYLTIWHPKDIVGGDIYLFEELRSNENECLLMVIDCTGHGVPGAFVTMLVKAIERQVIAKINNDPNINVSAAWILAYFNRTMKKLLRQEDETSISNAGFDGAVLYFNKEQQILKYAGANTPLFYTQNKELITIKGDKHSIGYKKSDMKFEFKEHIIPTQKGMEFFITTDGYLDQNGGEKGFPFGTKKFKNIIEEYAEESMADKQEVFLDRMQDHRGHEEQNDDITIIGIQI